jgi:hypothetical protein
MTKKQTSVQWLSDWMNKNEYFIGNDLLQAFEQAKALEKEQIEDAFGDSRILAITNNCSSGEQYYNETFAS